ncbi:hypothetical protein Lumi_035 [Xylophilus phage Lumi]|nr:hypothetical protein Lumi_035 [Xylophilus phage Lumi]
MNKDDEEDDLDRMKQDMKRETKVDIFILVMLVLIGIVLYK